MREPIFTTLGPNYQTCDVLNALWMCLQPWKWKKGNAELAFKTKFQEWLGIPVYLISSGRGAFATILFTLTLEKDDEVLIPAYTCVVVPDAILTAGAKVVYVDVDKETLNIDPIDVEKKISAKSRVLLIQHTFGRPAPMDELLIIARQYNLVVIEDCAHALGTMYHGKRVGTFGDASFFSFGRDKCLSSVFGGAIAIQNKALIPKIEERVRRMRYPSYLWIFQQLLHPLLVSFIKKTYIIGVGRWLLFILLRLHILSRSVTFNEKHGRMENAMIKKMPNALCFLAYSQFQRLESFNAHRREIAHIYAQAFGHVIIDGHSYLVYPLQSENSEYILNTLKQKKIFLGDWYRYPIAPKGTDYIAIDYQIGSCPVDESLSCTSFNLPTHIHITPVKAKRIIQEVQPLM